MTSRLDTADIFVIAGKAQECLIVLMTAQFGYLTCCFFTLQRELGYKVQIFEKKVESHKKMTHKLAEAVKHIKVKLLSHVVHPTARTFHTRHTTHHRRHRFYFKHTHTTRKLCSVAQRSGKLSRRRSRSRKSFRGFMRRLSKKKLCVSMLWLPRRSRRLLPYRS